VGPVINDDLPRANCNRLPAERHLLVKEECIMATRKELTAFFACLAVFCIALARTCELNAAPLPPQYSASRPTMPPMPPLPSGIPKMALQHLVKARKWQSDAILVAIHVRNYFMAPGSIPQHGVYGVYLKYFSPKSGRFQNYAVGPNGEDVLLQGMPPGAMAQKEIGMLPIHFVDLPEAFNALQAAGGAGRVQSATLHFIAGDQPNIYAVWDIKTLGGKRTRRLYVLADTGKVVDLADIHPNAVRGDPDVWLENLFSEYMQKIAAQNEANSSSPSSAGPAWGSRARPLCGSVGGEYSSCLDGGRLTNFRTYREAQSAPTGSPEE
jgi:hypothetical protein